MAYIKPKRKKIEKDTYNVEVELYVQPASLELPLKLKQTIFSWEGSKLLATKGRDYKPYTFAILRKPF